MDIFFLVSLLLHPDPHLGYFFPAKVPLSLIQPISI